MKRRIRAAMLFLALPILAATFATSVQAEVSFGSSTHR
jgi:hypothetical protein